MSLYNTVSESVAADVTATSLISQGITSVLGNGVAAAVGTSVAKSLVNKYVPVQYQKLVNVGAGAVSDILNGDIAGAALRIIDSNVVADYLPKTANALTRQRSYWGCATPLFGGITPSEALEIYHDLRGEQYAKANLWFLEISSELGDGGYNIMDRFNMFATEVQYSPYILSGDKIRIGGGTLDVVQNNEPVELQLTTYDDKDGNLKRWFALHHAAACAQDGTITEPGKYAIKIRVLHAYIKDYNDSSYTPSTAYEDIGLFRPDNLAVNLTRREDSLEELQMTFSQLDTFMDV